MRIATYNLRNLFGPGVRDEYGEPFTITDTFVKEYSEALLTVIKKLEADILVVEEVGSQKVLTDLVRMMGEEYKVFFADADARGISCAIVYRVPLSPATLPSVDGLPPLELGDDIRWQRLVPNHRDLVYAKGEYGGRPIHIFGLHLKANGGTALRDKEGKRVAPTSQRDHGDGLIRTLYYKLAEARRVRALLDAVFSEEPDAQIIVLGDMNDTPDSYVLRIILGLDAKNMATGLTDVSLEKTNQERFSHIYKGKKDLLDHILVSRSLLDRVKSVEIRNQDIVDQADMREEDILASDHAPVVMELA